jgi:hypothetical protein
MFLAASVNGTRKTTTIHVSYPHHTPQHTHIPQNKTKQPKTVIIAPVLPSTALAIALFLLLAYCRFSPGGIFNPANEPDRDFPSMFHPKSAASHRLRQRSKQQQMQQSQRLLAPEGGQEGAVVVVEEGKIGEFGEGVGRKAGMPSSSSIEVAKA